MRRLEGKIAVVTGASRGGGRGIAREIGEAGGTVYLTGRSTRDGDRTQGRAESIEDAADDVTAAGGTGIPVRCDHTIDAEVEALFARIESDCGRLDVLVNNAWGGYERPLTHDPFWDLDLQHWDEMFAAGVRSTVVATRLALPLMQPHGKGLIVNTTAPIQQTYLGNVFYDVAKTSITRMSSGMAADLREHGVAVIALAPGWMRTERVLEHYTTDEHRWRDVADLEKTESPRYAGRAVVALASDPGVLDRSGRMYEVGELAREYGFTDIDGRQVEPFSAMFPELFET
jgi:NAD(P)-dependent dehydrogenase (short-subunit alcohol dehydrogenase family)